MFECHVAFWSVHPRSIHCWFNCWTIYPSKWICPPSVPKWSVHVWQILFMPSGPSKRICHLQFSPSSKANFTVCECLDGGYFTISFSFCLGWSSLFFKIRIIVFFLKKRKEKKKVIETHYHINYYINLYVYAVKFVLLLAFYRIIW